MRVDVLLGDAGGQVERALQTHGGEGSPAVSVRDRRPDRLKTTAFEEQQPSRCKATDVRVRHQSASWTSQSCGHRDPRDARPPARAGWTTPSISACCASGSSSSAPTSRTTSRTPSARRCCCSPPRTPTRTSTSTSTAPVARSRRAWRSTTRCSSSRTTWRPSAMGLAASMGQFLLCAGATGKRYALPHARIMMHQPSGGIGGTASDIRIQAEQMLYTKKTMAELIAQHTGQTVEQIENDSDRDRWFTARGGQGLRLRRPRRPQRRPGRRRAAARPPTSADAGSQDTSTRGPPVTAHSRTRHRTAAGALRPPARSSSAPTQGVREYRPLRQALRGAHHLPRRADRRRVGGRRHGAAARASSRWTPTATSQIYINSPGGSLHGDDRDLRHHAVRQAGHPHRLPRSGRFGRCRAAGGGYAWQAARAAARRILIHQPYTEGGGQAQRHRDPGERDPADAQQMEGILARHTGRPSSTSAATSSGTRSSPPRRPRSTA